MSKKSTGLDKIEKSLWKFLLDKGGIVKDTNYSYYGSGPHPDCWSKDYKKFKEELGNSEIDWSKTSPIKDCDMQVFAGTFAESPDYVYWMEGEFVLKNGKKFTLVYKEHDKRNLAETMREIFSNIDLYMEYVK